MGDSQTTQDDRQDGYTYFFSYHYKRDDYTLGFGMADIVWPRVIREFADVQEITEAIRKANDVESVVVVNFQLLAGPDVSAHEAIQPDTVYVAPGPQTYMAFRHRPFEKEGQ